MRGKRRFNILLLAALTLGLAGCARVQPAPQPDMQPWPEVLGGAAAVTQPSHWWTAFNDPQLNRWIEQGLQQNYSLQAAWARLAQSEAVARQAGSERYPDLSVSLSRSRQWRNDVSTDLWSAGITTEYELDFWGRVSALQEQGRLNALASLQATRVQANTVAANIALNAYGLRMQQLNLQLLTQQQQRLQEALQVTQARFQRGQALISDVWQQQQLLEANQAERITATAEYQRYRHQLALWLGDPGWLQPGADDLPADAADLPVLTAEDTGVALAALQQRPDVQQAWFELQASNAAVAAAVANRFPRFTLTASYRGEDASLGNVFDDWIGNLAGGLVLPLIDGANRRAEVARQRAALEEGLADYQNTLLSAAQEVQDALTGNQQMAGRVASLERQLQLARDTESYQSNRYRKGSGDFLSLLTAQREVLSLEQQLLSARWQQLQYRIQLFRAVSHGDFAQKDEPV
ncbi:efflux transporter outer membrane subunit [Venatoribacter cucullus]|uniref:efflux transporter outer membrane subunit n=1 Tax=Venatoribacter cucullus TaxID=2661630 RepID=UPI00223F0ED0|nr:efflux transporter outer membrane subunit [Venatoribacter cucullus]UZK03416.1 efflux transporter outer membrane subunit [Venatoribacter cucullus]